jgi:paraquat-inducible protein A
MLGFAALLLAVPAAFLPLGSVNYMGNFNQVSMASLINRLFESQHYLIALFVFVTALLAPLLRSAVYYLLFLTLKSNRRAGIGGRLHKSLLLFEPLDAAPIFLVALTVGIVKFGAAGNVQTGGGALAFALMIAAVQGAANAFDAASAWEGETR